MGIKERSAARRRRMVSHRAASFAEADKWDLDFWLAQGPEQRLSALVAIHRDVAMVEKSRRKNKKTARKRNE